MPEILESALLEQKEQNEQSKLTILGTLGIPLGGSRLVEVPNRNSFVYVQLRDNQSEVIQAFNNKVAPSYGLPVVVQREGTRYIVLGVDSQRYQNNWNNFSPYLPRHGNTHSRLEGSGGGGDVVWIASNQFMPLLTTPSGSSGGPNIIVSPHTLQSISGTWTYVGNTGTANLLQYTPTGSNAVMVLVYLDRLSGNPYLVVNSGSYFANTITGTAEVTPYIPNVPNVNLHIPLSAVRLTTGTNIIGWDNIYDVRQFLQYITTGTGAGGGGGSSIDTIGFAGLYNGVPLGTGTFMNVRGDTVLFTKSGSMFDLFVTGSTHGHGVDQIGIYGLANGVPLGTGTWVDFGNNLTASISGTTIRVDAQAGGGGGGLSSLPIYKDGAFIVSGTLLNFEQNVQVAATGTFAYIKSPITTYFRVGQPNYLSNPTGLYWQVPDMVYASGSLGVFVGGHALIPGIDYIEQLWVSGTYRYLVAQPTGSYHLVHYGVPCYPQIQPPTGTSVDMSFWLTDSDGTLLTDSDNTQLTDSDG